MPRLGSEKFEATVVHPLRSTTMADMNHANESDYEWCAMSHHLWPQPNET